MTTPSLPHSNNNINISSKLVKQGVFLILILMITLIALEVMQVNQTLCRVVAVEETKGEGLPAALVVSSQQRSSPSTKTSLAYQDSLGFFVDIPDHLWEERRRIARSRSMYANPSQPLQSRLEPHAFYQMNHEPTLACLNEDMLGNMGDGHKWICDPQRIEERSIKNLQQKKDGCLIYSIGSEGKYDFEMDVQKRMPSCEIHTFDFTNYAYKIPPNLNISYHVWGLKPSYEEDLARFTGINFANQLWKQTDVQGVFKTIQETLRELGHEHRTIDVFKIDCEGCEWFSYKDWIDPSIDIRQIQIEIHEVPPMANEFFEDLHDAGFAMFHKEPNIQYTGGKCVEFSFLKMAPSFFGTGDKGPGRGSETKKIKKKKIAGR